MGWVQPLTHWDLSGPPLELREEEASLGAKAHLLEVQRLRSGPGLRLTVTNTRTTGPLAVGRGTSTPGRNSRWDTSKHPWEYTEIG